MPDTSSSVSSPLSPSESSLSSLDTSELSSEQESDANDIPKLKVSPSFESVPDLPFQIPVEAPLIPLAIPRHHPSPSHSPSFSPASATHFIDHLHITGSSLELNENVTDSPQNDRLTRKKRERNSEPEEGESATSMTLSKEMSEPPSKIPRIDSNTQRNKRLFGFIKSTLQKANQEQAQLIDTLRKREEILSTAQDRLRREKIEMEKKLRDDKKRQETMDSLKRALKKAQRAVERREYLNFLGHYKHVNDFLLLTSSPPLFWRPAKHTSITKKTLEDQVALRVQRQKVIAKELELRVQECEHELEKFMQDQNESALPEAES